MKVEQQEKQIDEEIQIKFDSYKEKITSSNQDKRAINTKLQTYFFGSNNG